jgi:hypothetical protein
MSRSGLLLILLGLVGCADSTGDFGLLRDTLLPGQAAFDPRFTALARTEPPAMQVALVDQEAASLVLLEASRDGIDTWLTPDGAGLILQDGMLRGTRGFGEGFLASDIAGSRALVLTGQPGEATRFHSYLQGDDTVQTRAFACRIENRGPRSVTIGGTPLPAQLMAESCRNATDDFVNLYWLADGSGQIVQTRQWIGPRLGVITTRQVPRP